MLNRFINLKSKLRTIVTKHLDSYATSTNLNYHYSYGFLLTLFFIIQIASGIFLAMHYTGNTELAFDSVRHIMVDVKGGSYFRYMHANGASFIFIFMYAHMGRGLYYRSYLYQRIWVWISGVVIFLLMMGTAFIGYVLPWGQMSYWGATVITNLVTAIPVYGPDIALWIWGGFSVSNATLTRFYSLHYLLPFVIVALITTHIALLHQVGSSNPLGIKPELQIPFAPAFIYKDLFAGTIALGIYFYIVFFCPNLLGHPDNFIPADAMVTPAHIVPEWYFTPFYAILRAFSNKTLGIIFMVLAILVLMLLPLVKVSYKVSPGPLSTVYKVTTWLFFFNFFTLLYLGSQPVCEEFVIYSQIATTIYFLYFVFCLTFPLLEEYYCVKRFGPKSPSNEFNTKINPAAPMVSNSMGASFLTGILISVIVNLYFVTLVILIINVMISSLIIIYILFRVNKIQTFFKINMNKFYDRMYFQYYFGTHNEFIKTNTALAVILIFGFNGILAYFVTKYAGTNSPSALYGYVTPEAEIKATVEVLRSEACKGKTLQDLDKFLASEECKKLVANQIDSNKPAEPKYWRWMVFGVAAGACVIYTIGVVVVVVFGGVPPGK